jgi:hypothetical protein
MPHPAAPFNEALLHTDVFVCEFIMTPGEGTLELHGVPVAQQVTAFFASKDAWPVAHSLTMSPPYPQKGGKLVLTHVFTLTWVTRSVWLEMQARITATALAIREQERIPDVGTTPGPDTQYAAGNAARDGGGPVLYGDVFPRNFRDPVDLNPLHVDLGPAGGAQPSG